MDFNFDLVQVTYEGRGLPCYAVGVHFADKAPFTIGYEWFRAKEFKKGRLTGLFPNISQYYNLILDAAETEGKPEHLILLVRMSTKPDTRDKEDLSLEEEWGTLYTLGSGALEELPLYRKEDVKDVLEWLAQPKPEPIRYDLL